MLSKLRSLFRREPPPAPFRGRPKVRREKNYSADTGYVYQYFYEGYREATRGEQAGAEYVFDVSSDRRSRFLTTVFLSETAVSEWREQSGRELNPTEQYAVVKMTLFEAFDEHQEFDAEALEVDVRVEDIARHAETLEL